MEPAKQPTKILCARCNAVGMVTWIKDALCVRIDDLSRGFICVDRGNADDPHCECAHCRIPVVIVDEPQLPQLRRQRGA